MSDNQFMDPARERFQALLREAEQLQAPTDSTADPLEDFRRAEEYGVPSWIPCMLQVETCLAQLRTLSVDKNAVLTPARTLFLEVAVGSLNALILYEQGQKGLDPKTLDWVVATYHDEIVARIVEGEKDLEQERFTTLDQIAPKEDDLGPGDDTGPWKLDDDKVEEVPAEQAGHDFRPNDEPPDIDQAERSLARQMVALRQTAAGSSAVQIGGTHASPANTDPDMVETGKHTKE
jgi:hypothetical protein